MEGNGYEEAVEFNKAMCDELRSIAKENNLDPGRLVGLWDSTIEVNVEGIGKAKGFVWKIRNKTYTSKSFNIFLRLQRLLVMIIENGLTLSSPETKTQTIQLALNILFQLSKASTIEISESQSLVLYECNMQNAYLSGILEEELLKKLANVTSSTIDELIKLRCVRMEEGFVFLNEKIVL